MTESEARHWLNPADIGWVFRTFYPGLTVYNPYSVFFKQEEKTRIVKGSVIFVNIGRKNDSSSGSKIKKLSLTPQIFVNKMLSEDITPCISKPLTPTFCLRWIYMVSKNGKNKSGGGGGSSSGSKDVRMAERSWQFNEVRDITSLSDIYASILMVHLNELKI
uniref:Uncharacterized protein n=1 Tax=Glossina pallidipes TaxID=7398 RepID=A0A1A9ZND1_GLOPL